LAALRDPAAEQAIERRARQARIAYIKLEGHIGCLVNGAGLAMATMDVIKLYGGAPANFLDVGGGARADRVATALDLILTDPDVDAVLVNIFGGITRCDEAARGILTALEAAAVRRPMVVRLVGTNEEAGRTLLQAVHLPVAVTLADAAQWAVAAAREARP
ncbi:MAG: succinate--CoA ligase subunit beta, partial [Chloroflexota bacterium]